MTFQTERKGKGSDLDSGRGWGRELEHVPAGTWATMQQVEQNRAQAPCRSKIQLILNPIKAKPVWLVKLIPVSSYTQAAVSR